MTGEAFLARLDELAAEHRRAPPSIGCIQTTSSVACADCVFCRDCERCFSARYSIACRDAFDITHCVACRHCYACTFCKRSEHCAHSNFLVYCIGCIHCDYCFGCVGLEKKYFHILNRPYARKDYFRIVKELEQLLPGLTV